MDANVKSKLYATGQSGLLLVFMVVVFFDPGPALFRLPAARVAGGVLSALGLVMMLAAFIVIRRVIQIEPAPRADGELITHGIYGWLRHPIYTAILVLVTGIFLRQPTFAVGALGIAVIALLIVKSRFEEQLLAARYPDYARYREHTWGVLPPFC